MSESRDSEKAYAQADFVWALQTACALHKKPFHATLLLQQFPPPYDKAALIRATRALGFKSQLRTVKPEQLQELPLPLLVEVKSGRWKGPTSGASQPGDSDQVTDVLATSPSLAVLVAISGDQVVCLPANTESPITLSLVEFTETLTGRVYLLYPQDEALRDPDAAQEASVFGFRWFVPELLKHRKVWHEVLGASLVIQLLALGLPLFTQAIIDKVVVNRTDSTLIALGIGMTVFMLFTALLTWVRQYAICTPVIG
jgi:ATP-binding cassette, subfamily B, bacterial HlyB/CyaB